MNVDVASSIETVGRAFIAALFLHQGYYAMIKRYGFHTERLRSRKFPVPSLVLAIGFAMMFGGAGMMLLNIYAGVGAVFLLIFSVLATVLFQNFWTIKEPERRAEKRASFMFNLAVIGGILMVIARNQM
jgi:putative oxidoreductase